MFPSRNLPTWLTVLNQIDPLTYAVDSLRRLVFDHLHGGAGVRARLDAGVSWNAWHVPTTAEVGVIAVIGVAMLSVAIVAFSRSEYPPSSFVGRGVSRYVAEALEHEERRQAGRDWLADQDREHGPVLGHVMLEVRRRWLGIDSIAG